MKNLLISACLLGIDCRYDGRSVRGVDIDVLKERFYLVPVCPEIYGGLPTPRVPSERVGDRVMMKDGRDVTENYLRGARAALELCRSLDCEIALLKEKSPSCGSGKIYDGSFDGNLIDGMGVTAEYLTRHNIKVYSEGEIDKLLEEN